MPYVQLVYLFDQGSRIEADYDLRQYRVVGSVHDTEFAKSFIEERSGLLGEISKYTQRITINADAVLDENQLDPEFDRERLRAMKARHKV